ncbi:PQQ-binding-like beta-propeller repeat protein [Flagellimonas halotolerans]|uniref:PQQ-binding-like beta-propeller repeat protein n=1 Tax=Flagellimonas halotolerans TaxID=3112164 RepID=A0ABU6IPE1_9FLAO|nr:MULTISPECIES: PQQ-binding-like beta-propeller repeat protein [unclassified Allomuricauda]MEC3965266.1 PQQ-binding-like beta-propeller repeat protein [Muricauda sp. SYSU M86414]MEC4264889.1 PQQ-binding-like beta-propeller repeat protein [Muricauda sp. SYSU M84420]
MKETGILVKGEQSVPTLVLILFVATVPILVGGCVDDNKKYLDSFTPTLETGKDWPVYGGSRASKRYSPLTQITMENVGDLEIAWTYDARDQVEGAEASRPRSIQCQPIVKDGILYGTTPELQLFALRATTGEELWRFKPVRDSRKYNISAGRGVTYWQKGIDCRIIYTSGTYLYAINAKTGNAIPSFGEDGRVDLHEGLDDGLDLDMGKVSINATSPGIIYKDIFIIGSSVSEKGDAAPGNIRAFDVVTGKLKWVFHTIPHPGEEGYDTWPKDAYKEHGGVNSWGGMSLDVERGMVFFGTGSPSSDFYGGNRKGKNLFANSVVALDAKTGKLEWYFQTVRHDLWDRDLPCAPNLTTITVEGEKRDVVVQAGKDGLVYVLDRENGTSVFPIEERKVPILDGLPGEQPYPSQIFPIKPEPLSHQFFREDMITDLSPESRAYVKGIVDKYQIGHKFSLPSESGTLMFGYSGGAEWGGNATDLEGILYQNSNNDPWILEMEDVESRDNEMQSVRTGADIYRINCAMCHGSDKKGTAEFPSLVNIGDRLASQDIESILESGMGRMPAFRHISKKNRKAVTAFLLDLPMGMHPGTANVPNTSEAEENIEEPAFGYEPRYVPKVWKKLKDQNGYPGIKPPWGTLNAIDLNTGEYLWRVPLGEYPELTEQGIPITGTESYGGPIVTASGLVFIAGTKDEKIRAFDKRTGKVVWEYQLPAGGFATPITYEADNRQYVVIAAGGGRGQKPGGYYIAFALKNKPQKIN